MKPAFFKSAAAFRGWLDKHHAVKCELLVGLYRKETGGGIRYQEALDEALCFGGLTGFGSESTRKRTRSASPAEAGKHLERGEHPAGSRTDFPWPDEDGGAACVRGARRAESAAVLV